METFFLLYIYRDLHLSYLENVVSQLVICTLSLVQNIHFCFRFSIMNERVGLFVLQSLRWVSAKMLHIIIMSIDIIIWERKTGCTLLLEGQGWVCMEMEKLIWQGSQLGPGFQPGYPHQFYVQMATLVISPCSDLFWICVPWRGAVSATAQSIPFSFTMLFFMRVLARPSHGRSALWQVSIWPF